VASPAALTDGLAGIVGAERVLADPGSVERYAVDGRSPRWVAIPAGLEALSRLLAFASEERLATVPRGSGSRIGLGNVPARVDLVVEMTRLSGLVEHSPDDLTATVQAGMTLGALAARLAVRRQFLPLDPPGGVARTAGGVVAANDSGPLRFRYGTARDLILGARFVQADGTLTWGGARVVKSVTGYDVPKLLVGSLGTLGVLAELTLRLHPIPEVEGHWLITFPSAPRAGEFLASVLDSPLQPSRLELLNAGALSGLGCAPAPAAVAVTVGSVAEAVRSQSASLVGLAVSCGAGERIPLAGDFWPGLARLLATHDGVTLKIATLPVLVWDRLGLVERLAGAKGVAAYILAEAGNGVIRSCLDGQLSPEAWERDIILPLREHVRAEGGSVVVEAAPPALKERLDVWGPIEPGVLGIMKRLKVEFDPRGILNPSRFVDRI
jgi:glycolate oxidase FAD binding subunit